MGTVTDINEHQPHRVFEAICVACHYRYIAVVPAGTPLRDLECDSCHRIRTIINTGQEIPQ